MKEIEELADKRFPTAKDDDANSSLLAQRNAWIDGYKEGAKLSQWHSLADGDFPEEAGEYLCADDDYYEVAGYDKRGKYFYSLYSRFDDERLSWVKYWTELPEPPKRGGDE